MRYQSTHRPVKVEFLEKFTDLHNRPSLSRLPVSICPKNVLIRPQNFRFPVSKTLFEGRYNTGEGSQCPLEPNSLAAVTSKSYSFLLIIQRPRRKHKRANGDFSQPGGCLEGQETCSVDAELNNAEAPANGLLATDGTGVTPRRGGRDETSGKQPQWLPLFQKGTRQPIWQSGLALRK